MEEANDVKDADIKAPVVKEKKTLISKLRDKLGDLVSIYLHLHLPKPDLCSRPRKQI